MNMTVVTGTAYAQDKIADFITPSELSDRLEKKGISITSKELVQLVHAGMLPAFFFNANQEKPLFIWGDIQAYIGRYLIWRSEVVAAVNLKTVSLHHKPEKGSGLPLPLMAVENLCELKMINQMAIYFLCLSSEIVYVGQTIRLAQRVFNHISDKQFDRVFYISVPEAEADYVEKKFIEHLKPRYNVVHNYDEYSRSSPRKIGSRKTKIIYERGAGKTNGTHIGSEQTPERNSPCTSQT